MRKAILSTVLILGTTGLALAASENSTSVKVTISPPAEGSVTPEQGLEAWKRIYEVTTSPRCANCHTGEDNIPMWSGPSYGKTKKHGMNINAGDSRIGAETLPCATCHTTSTKPNTIPHAPPHFGIDWALAPVEFEWFGKTSPEICAQLKDPARNGGRESFLEIAQHLQHDAELGGPVAWGWNPGGGREPAPRTLQEHVDDVLIWGTAGSPCPTE